MALHGDGHVNDKALQGSLHQPHHRGCRLGAADVNVHLKVVGTPATCTAGINKRMLHCMSLPLLFRHSGFRYNVWKTVQSCDKLACEFEVEGHMSNLYMQPKDARNVSVGGLLCDATDSKPDQYPVHGCIHADCHQYNSTKRIGRLLATAKTERTGNGKYAPEHFPKK